MPSPLHREERNIREVTLETTCGGTNVKATITGGKAYAYFRGGSGKAESLLNEALVANGLASYGGRSGDALYIRPTRLEQTAADVEQGVTRAMEVVAACARLAPIRRRS